MKRLITLIILFCFYTNIYAQREFPPRRQGFAPREEYQKIYDRGVVTGKILDEEGRPLSGANITIFGTELSSYTDENGLYRIDNIPVGSPRYIVTAEKSGYFKASQGNISVVKDGTTQVNLTIKKEVPEKSYLKEELTVKVAYLIDVKQVSRDKPTPGENAVLDPSLYPNNVKTYLKPGKYIESDSPSVQKIAEEILNSIPIEDRKKQTVVAKAVYDWMVKNIEYDLMKIFPGDVTSGNWQTVNGGWGNSFTEWCYTPEEMLREKRAICIEHARLCAALLRALNIPARPAPLGAHPVTQWWVQMPDGSGYWSNMDTSRGRTDYSKRGDTSLMFTAVSDDRIAFYSIDSDAPIHMDWWTDNPCVWREETRPGRSFYEYSQEGLQDAEKELEKFSKEGIWEEKKEGPPGIGRFPGEEMPQRERPSFREGFQKRAGFSEESPQRGFGQQPSGSPMGGRRGRREEPLQQVPHYELNSRGFTIDLSNLGDQKTITVKFPIFFDSNYKKTLKVIHWTNHPEWVTRTWREEKSNPETNEKITYYCLGITLI